MSEQLSFSATHLHVIDGMPNDHNRTAPALIAGLRNRLREATRPLEIVHHPVGSTRDVVAALNAVQQSAEVGQLPMLHLDGHADRVGFRASNGDTYLWTSMWETFRHINVACKNNLIVTVGACEGLHAILASIFSITLPSPIFALVAPHNIVAGETVEAGFELYFEHVFRTGDISAAFAELVQIDQSADDHRGDFRLVTAQGLFERTAEKYLRENCMGHGAAKRYVGLIDSMAADGKNSRKARQTLRAQLRKPQALALKKYHHLFMMLDMHPELAGRISMDYVRFERKVRSTVLRTRA